MPESNSHTDTTYKNVRTLCQTQSHWKPPLKDDFRGYTINWWLKTLEFKIYTVSISIGFVKEKYGAQTIGQSNSHTHTQTRKHTKTQTQKHKHTHARANTHTHTHFFIVEDGRTNFLAEDQPLQSSVGGISWSFLGQVMELCLSAESFFLQVDFNLFAGSRIAIFCWFNIGSTTFLLQIWIWT